MLETRRNLIRLSPSLLVTIFSLAVVACASRPRVEWYNPKVDQRTYSKQFTIDKGECSTLAANAVQIPASAPEESRQKQGRATFSGYGDFESPLERMYDLDRQEANLRRVQGAQEAQKAAFMGCMAKRGWEVRETPSKRASQSSAVPQESVSSKTSTSAADVTSSATLVLADPADRGRFLRLDGRGFAMKFNTTGWSCFRDTQTNLIWGRKDEIVNASDWPSASQQVNTSNSEKVCGFESWRLPTRSELTSLLTADGASAMDALYPNAYGTAFWTGETATNNKAYFVVLRGSGQIGADWIATPKRVLLVRGRLSEARR